MRRLRPCAILLDVAGGAALRLDPVIHPVLVAVDAPHPALEMDVTRNRVRRRTHLGDGVAGEAVLVARLAHAECAPPLVVEPCWIVHDLFRHLEEMVIGVLRDIRIPRRLEPRVHALDARIARRRQRGAAPVLAQRLLRPFAHVVVVLRMAREAVHL